MKKAMKNIFGGKTCILRRWNDKMKTRGEVAVCTLVQRAAHDARRNDRGVFGLRSM
jgi:hypothetical protein